MYIHKNSFVFYLLGFIYISFFSITSFALSNSEKAAYVQSLFQPSRAPKALYRYQAKRYIQQLIDAGNFNDYLFRLYMIDERTKGIDIAGRGLYAAGRPTSSLMAVPPDIPGGLAEVQIAQGTPFLDLTDRDIRSRIESKGISIKDDIPNLNINGVIKYDEEKNWWLIKTQKGIRFSEFTGEGISNRDLLDYYNNVSGRHPGGRLFREKADPVLIERAKKSEYVLEHLPLQTRCKAIRDATNVSEMLKFASPLKEAETNEYINEIQKEALLSFLQKNPQPSEVKRFEPFIISQKNKEYLYNYLNNKSIPTPSIQRIEIPSTNRSNCFDTALENYLNAMKKAPTIK